jgi:hypothetical protein
MGREEPSDSYPKMNEWGGAWAVSGQVQVVWAISKSEVGNLHKHMSSELSLLLTSLTFFEFGHMSKHIFHTG